MSNILFSDFNVDIPQINIKVDWVELSKTKEYYDKYSTLETVRLGDTITAELYGMNFQTRCIKTVYDVLLDRVVKFEIGTFQPNFVSSTAQQIKSINDAITQINPASLLNKAQENATNQITTAMGGYVLKTQNELLIMDTPDTATAVKVWRWNLGGLGYSESGVNGPYETAITQDGAIVADFITAGSIATARIQGLQDILDGINSSLTLNNSNIQLAISRVENIEENGVSRVVNTLVTIDENGVNVSKTGQDLTSLITNEGFYVYRDKDETSEVTMLSANSTGVNAENMTVRKFFTAGTHSRTEDYIDELGPGTGVFFLSGGE